MESFGFCLLIAAGLGRTVDQTVKQAFGFKTRCCVKTGGCLSGADLQNNAGCLY